MCIAIANMKGNALSDEQLTNCWENNPDGAGILYKDKGMLKVYKNQGDLEKFKKKYYQVVENSNCLVHFRVKSAGVISMSNIHPFMVNKDLGFIHNGTIHKMPKDDALSDTQIFNKAILKNLPKDFTKNEPILELMEDYCGYSKLVFMDKDESFTIINEDKGHWSNGNWYSNTSYKQVNSYYYRGSQKVAKSSGTTTSKLPTTPKLPPATVKEETKEDDSIDFPPYDPWDEYYANSEDWYPGYEEDLASAELDADPVNKSYADWVEELCDVIDQVDYELIEKLDYESIKVSQVMVEELDNDDGVNLYLKDCEKAIQYVNDKHGKIATLEGCVAIYEAQEAI